MKTFILTILAALILVPLTTNAQTPYLLPVDGEERSSTLIRAEAEALEKLKAKIFFSKEFGLSQISAKTFRDRYLSFLKNAREGMLRPADYKAQVPTQLIIQDILGAFIKVHRGMPTEKTKLYHGDQKVLKEALQWNDAYLSNKQNLNRFIGVIDRLIDAYVKLDPTIGLKSFRILDTQITFEVLKLLEHYSRELHPGEFLQFTKDLATYHGIFFNFAAQANLYLNIIYQGRSLNHFVGESVLLVMTEVVQYYDLDIPVNLEIQKQVRMARMTDVERAQFLKQGLQLERLPGLREAIAKIKL